MERKYAVCDSETGHFFWELTKEEALRWDKSEEHAHSFSYKDIEEWVKTMEFLR